MSEALLTMLIAGQAFGWGYLAGRNKGRSAYRIYRDTANEYRKAIADMNRMNRTDNWRN